MTKLHLGAWGLAVVLLAACADPIPELGGVHQVGTTTRDLSDGKRTLPVRLWYPASPLGTESKLKVTDEVLAEAMDTFMGFPRLANDTNLLSRSWIDAPPALTKDRWPLVVFDHGNWSFSTQNLRQMEDLASRGFVVASLIHPGESLNARPDKQQFDEEKARQVKGLDAFQRTLATVVPQLAVAPDLSAAQTSALPLRSDPLFALLIQRLESRTADLGLFLDSRSALANDVLFREKVSLEPPILMGHSLGAMTATLYTLAHPDRVRALINLDGPAVPGLSTNSPTLAVPALFFYASAAKYGSETISHEGMNRALARTSRAPAWEVTVEGASHHNFTDLTFVGGLSLFGLTGPVDGLRAGVGIQERIADFLSGLPQGSWTAKADDGVFKTVRWN